MTIGNIVDLGNKLEITAWATPFNPIGKTFDLLVHPANQGTGALHGQHVARTRYTSVEEVIAINKQALPDDMTGVL